ncbi:MAG: damage-inducible protein DinB [Alphaproteobacteria bacterium]|nr:damage-inducible protein DinB [Alphaproteobacteria bacterium]
MTEGLIPHFRRLARYNRLANERVYDVCSVLTDKERKQSRSGFFGSIHGTLNHILVGDRIWMARFQGGEAPSTGLDTILHRDFDGLRTARAVEDARIEAWVAALETQTLRGDIAYVNNEGRQFNDPVSILLAHFFNHQTHHRGQVTAMLAETAAPYPVLDMHRVLIPEPRRP